MLLPSLLAAGALAMTPLDQTPFDAVPRVTRVSLFKNGLAYVVSEVEVPAGQTWVRIRPMPVPVHGSLSVSAAQGDVVKELIATDDEVSEEVEARSVADLLTANPGREPCPEPPLEMTTMQSAPAP